jgi:DNA end-binding protein Ku
VSQEDLDSVKVESSAVMTVEKFIDADSIDPMYYDASYFLAPDAQAGEDVYAVLREAIAETGKVALTRVVIAQRERTVALRPMGIGLMAHTLYEERDLNSPRELFEDAAQLKTDPQMVSLAIQLIKRQSARYDPADTEDRYETRLRAMLDAKLKGEGVDTEEEVPAERSNVIDLMAALKKSLGQTVEEPKAAAAAAKSAPAPKKKKSPSADDVRRQPGLKLAIKGGKTEAAERPRSRLRRLPKVGASGPELVLPSSGCGFCGPALPSRRRSRSRPHPRDGRSHGRRSRIRSIGSGGSPSRASCLYDPAHIPEAWRVGEVAQAAAPCPGRGLRPKRECRFGGPSGPNSLCNSGCVGMSGFVVVTVFRPSRGAECSRPPISRLCLL